MARNWSTWMRSRCEPESCYKDGVLKQGLQIQKGILQLCKGLQFLHTSARLIHTNINPESILINQSVRDIWLGMDVV